MNFKHYSKKEKELNYQEGIKNGYQLESVRQEFLKKVTYHDMRKKNWQRAYDRLFNLTKI